MSRTNIDLNNAEFVCDLINYEGPFLSLYKQDGENILVCWADVMDKFHLWFAYNVTEEQLNALLKHEITLYSLVVSASKMTMMISSSGSIIHSEPVQQMPPEYLPAIDSFLADELMTDAARQMVK